MKPCPQCPWRRSVEPGALGGSEPEVYIGQSVGPYKLPCHRHYIDDPEWRREDTIDTPDCIGAAVFRANIGVTDFLPSALLKQPSDRTEVFADHAEFLAHHKKIDLATARAELAQKSPFKHLEDQLKRSSNMVWLTKK